MEVAKHLRKFLSEHPQAEAAVVGLGVFYNGEYNGGKAILFKETPPSDMSFLNFMAFEESMEPSQVRVEVEKWVNGILSSLKSAGRAEIPQVGSFVLQGGAVSFNPVSVSNDASSVDFGLDPAFQPTESNGNQNNPVSGPMSGSQDGNKNRFVERSGNERNVASDPRKDNVRGSGNQPRSGVDNNRGPARSDRPGNSWGRTPGNGVPASNKPGVPVNAGKGASGAFRPANGNPGQVTSKPGSNPGSKEPVERPFYLRWWFILCVVLLVVIVLLFAIRPVRESIFQKSNFSEISMEPMTDTDTVSIEQGVVEMIESEVGNDGNEQAWSDDYAVQEEAKAVETQAIANAVMEGERQKREAEAAARKVEAKSSVQKQEKAPKKVSSTKTSASSVKTTVSKKEKPVSGSALEKNVPEAGKIYIIVGSFSSRENAKKMSDEMSAKGLSPRILYIKSKNVYYVSVKTCSSRDEAVSVRADIRDNKKVDCWIFSN